MRWHELYPKEIIPDMGALAEYMGEGRPLWLSLTRRMAERGVKPKLTYSVCSGKPGWNVKYQKGGQALGTFYPEENAFSALVVVAYRQWPEVERILPELSEPVAGLVRAAGDYMKMGKWLMLRIDTPEALEDLKRIIAAKMAA